MPVFLAIYAELPATAVVLEFDDQPDERRITMERHMAKLVKTKKIDLLEAQKWANDLKSFIDAMNTDVDVD